MSRRVLKPEEQELWQQVAQTTEPLFALKKRPKETIKKPKKPTTAPKSHKIKEFRIGAQTTDTRPKYDLKRDLRTSLDLSPVQMDKRAYGKLKRGKIRPEATLDLHGMTLEQGQPALVQFILTAAASDKRLVLIITGKGKSVDDYGPIPRQKGVLRHNVPRWLSIAPLAPLVLQVTTAHVKHGGSGAYYVYLRRKKEKK